ncbi:MAG: hypothetical protein ACJAZO_004892 [Myxococcota bacterium]|jgi:hypothetical protein
MFRTLTALLFPTVAFAVPTTVHHQGRLLDADGAPMQGSVALTFGLYGADEGGISVR